MKRLGVMASVCALFVVCAGPAEAALTVVTFEDLPAGPFAVYAEGQVSFTAIGGGLLQEVPNTPNGTAGITGVGAGTPEVFPELRADIAGGARSVSVDLGDFNADTETLFLEVFDSSGASLGSVSEFRPLVFGPMQTLSLDAPVGGPCICYAIFGGRQSTAGNGSSVSADNFTFESCLCPPVIPAPGAVLLGMIGTGVVGYMRRRRTL